MQPIKVVPHGSAGQPAVIMASTVAEAIEGWSRQQDFAAFPLNERPLLEVVGFETEEQMRAPTDVTEIHVAPAMFGGGGFGRILLGAALIVAAVAIPGVSAALAGALIGSGVGMILGGIVQLFLKAPSLGKDNDPEPSKYLGMGGNTTDIGTIIGFGGGRMMVGGQLLSLQVNSSDLAVGTYPETPT
mgnify:CR=1 FL=1